MYEYMQLTSSPEVHPMLFAEDSVQQEGDGKRYWTQRDQESKDDGRTVVADGETKPRAQRLGDDPAIRTSL